MQKGADTHIRTVTATEFDLLKSRLLHHAILLPPINGFNGNVYQLPDGERFGLRISKNHGETIDVIMRATKLLDRDFKVHWKPNDAPRTDTSDAQNHLDGVDQPNSK